MRVSGLPPVPHIFAHHGEAEEPAESARLRLVMLREGIVVSLKEALW